MKAPATSLLFFMPFGYWQVHLQLDLAVASAARVRGFRTTCIRCDAFYQPCAMERGTIDCETCQGSMNQISSQFSISGEPLGALVTADEIAKAEAWIEGLGDEALTTATYDDLEVGDWALSTVMTHFRIGNLADLGQTIILGTHRRFLRDTLLTFWAIERVIERDRIEAAFLFNGRFYPYRAALEACRRHGLRVLVHERGRIAHSFTFFENEGCLSSKTLDALVAAWADQALDADQLHDIDQHFSQLMLGRSPSWPSFYNQITKVDPRAALGIPADATIVAFFSSSSDEIAAQISFAKVSSQFDLIETIAAILEDIGVYLIVRHHPHIGGGPVGSPVEPSAFFEAYAHMRARRSNIRVVMPKDDLSSYAIFPHIDGAIAPFTSLGLESTAFGIPTLVAQGSISSFDPTYSIDDWSAPALREKIAFLLGPHAALNGERLGRFYRTFYSRFHRFSVQLDAVKITDYVRPSVHPDYTEHIRPGQDRALDRIMDCLTHGRHVHERPGPKSPTFETTPSTAERDYVAARLEAFEMRLSRAREDTQARPASSREDKSLAILCEEPSLATAVSARMRELPGADRVSIVPFRPTAFPLWRKWLGQLFGTKETFEFGAWSHGLRMALDGVEEPHVMVVSRRHQLHDASIATILSDLKPDTEPAGEVRPLSGWFGSSTQLLPKRVSASTLTAQAWSDLRQEFSTELREQDVLSLGVVAKEWLRQNMKTAAHLRTGFLDELRKSAQVPSTCPVFLWAR